MIVDSFLKQGVLGAEVIEHFCFKIQKLAVSAVYNTKTACTSVLPLRLLVNPPLL